MVVAAGAVAAYTGWAPDPAAPDVGAGLVAAFGHLARVVAERVNLVPEKNRRAFLDLIGVRRRPSEPARVPLTVVGAILVAAGGGFMLSTRRRQGATKA